MDKTNIIDRVNAALSGDLSFEQANDLWNEVSGRIREIERRLDLIHHGGRQEVVDTGSPEGLVEIDREIELLQAESEQLRRARDRVNSVRETARRTETEESFPDDLERFDELLAAEADAAAALDRARGRTDRKMAELNSARTLLRGRDLPSGSPEAARTYCELRGIRADSRGEIQPPGSLQRAQQAASALGVELPNLRPQFRASA